MTVEAGGWSSFGRRRMRALVADHILSPITKRRGPTKQVRALHLLTAERNLG
jgi:hypothetical protein